MSNQEWDELFASVRRSPFTEDPNEIPQQQGAGSGNIAPTGWLEDGSVTADVIRAGSVETDKLAANAVTAAKIEAGTITSNEIAAATITSANIAANTITAGNIASNAVTADEIAANTITASEIAAGTITANEIAADAITTSELAANAVITENILAANVTSSRIEVTVSGKNFGANDGSTGTPGLFFDAVSNTGILRNSGSDSLALATGGVVRMTIGSSGGNISHLKFVPLLDNALDLGSSSVRWATVYRVAESAVSDEREKKDIADAPLGLSFIRRLRPRIFRWRDTPDTQAQELATQNYDAEAHASEAQPIADWIEAARDSPLDVNDPDALSLEAGIEEMRDRLREVNSRHLDPVRESQQRRRPGRRLHYGLIAQEVKQALDDSGVDPMDAGFWQENPNGEQALSYSELTIPLLRAVQELSARVESLENELAEGSRGKS